MTFQEKAREIVANTIKSAICIDDEYVEPYKEREGRARNTNQPGLLTESFRKSNCSLDIYTFRSYRQLKEDSGFVFNNRDLLILDWELTDDRFKFADALLILNDAVINPSLGFVLIYTQKQDLTGIEILIRYFFNNKIKSDEERKKCYKNFLKVLKNDFFSQNDTEYDSAEELFKNKAFKDIYNEYILGRSLSGDKATAEFKKGIISLFGEDKAVGGKFIGLFESSVKNVYQCEDLFEACEQLEFSQKESDIPQASFEHHTYCHRIEKQPHALWINNTYITIVRKNDFKPERVYEHFSNQLCRRPGNIMTLIALEMRNHFIENSGKVGKDLLSIDELAFFSPRLNDNKKIGKEEFYDFLKNNWKHQVASFHLDSGSEVFAVLDDYISANSLKDRFEKSKDKKPFIEEVGKLNYQYSFHHAGRKEKDHLRFGDIFSFRESGSDGDVIRYLINITAHCDCLRPKTKIKYNFYFVLGDNFSLKKGLEKATREDQSFSFLYRNGGPVCISWKEKPFTIYLPDEKRFFYQDKPIKVRIEDEDQYLYYEGKLLENYTQKIANKAFANAARVGIDLVEL
jgi:hypothetical protein